MRSLEEALKLQLKNKKKYDWYLDDDTILARKIAYNAALDDITEFIRGFEAGEINDEFLKSLEERFRV